MISVCIATYNGGRFIREQLESILCSPLVGEVIVSDDRSSDGTMEIVRSLVDPRVVLVQGPGRGLICNFASLLERASGDIVFLADQDDVWLPNKVEVMLEQLRYSDLVVCDCKVVNAELSVLHPSFFSMLDSGPGFVRNLWKNRYLGCCMAFRRSVLQHALPFPSNLPMHDWWLGLIAETFGRVEFIRQPLVLYRRHGRNASITSEVSRVPWRIRIHWRLNLLVAVAGRKIGSIFSSTF